MTKDQYIRSLDLYIVSHGGVGSNYLTNYLLSKGINTKSDERMRQKTCHRAKYLKGVKTILIYGDYANSIISMEKRGVLGVNATKLNYDRDSCIKIDHKSNDPLGIYKLLSVYAHVPYVFRIEYPFTKSDIGAALKWFDFNVDISDIQIKKRSTNLGSIIQKYV